MFRQPYQKEIIYSGHSLTTTPPRLVNDPGFVLPTHTGNLTLRENANLALDGLTQFGKTTEMRILYPQQTRWLEKYGGWRVCFDAKGDYAGMRDARAVSLAENPWNLFLDIMDGITAPGETDSRELVLREIYNRSYEIAQELFRDRTEGSGTNEKFFPIMAAQVLGGLLYVDCLDLLDVPECHFDNSRLFEYATLWTRAEMAARLQASDCSWLNSIIAILNMDNNEAAGIYSELIAVLRQRFSGSWGAPGTFSIRKAIRECAGDTLLLPFRLDQAETDAAVYRAFLDYALKLCAARTPAGRTRIFVNLDELPALVSTAKLHELDFVANYGLTRGIRIIIAYQGMAQLQQHMGKAAAEALLQGFTQKIWFRPSAESQEYCTRQLGNVKRSLVHFNPNGQQVTDAPVTEPVVKPGVFSSMIPGEAIISLGNETAPIHTRFIP